MRKVCSVFGLSKSLNLPVLGKYLQGTRHANTPAKNLANASSVISQTTVQQLAMMVFNTNTVGIFTCYQFITLH